MARLYKTTGYEAQQTELEIQIHPHSNALDGWAETERGSGLAGAIFVVDLVGVFFLVPA